MSRLITITAFLAAFSLAGCGEFLDNPKSTGSQLIQFDGGEIVKTPYNFITIPRDLFFVDSKTGFLVGDNGHIYKTADAGGNWQKKTSGTTINLHSVMFINEQAGFAAGHAMNGCLDVDCNKGSVLLKTIDGGETWTKTFFSGYVRMENVHFFDTQRGLAVLHTPDVPNSRDYHLSSTSDGGLSWEFIDLEIRPEVVFHVVDNHIFIAGENQKIFRSGDLGVTWETIDVPLPVSADAGRMYFYNRNFGLVGGVGLIYRTVDGGANWESIDPPFASLDLCYFYDELAGYNIESVFEYKGGDMPVFKGTTIYRTTNGGKSWLNIAASDAIYIPMSSFPSTDLGFGTNYAEFFTIRKK